MVGLKIALVCFVAVADISGGKAAEVNVPEPPPAVVWETPTEAPTQAPVYVPPVQEGFVAYRIHGYTPPIEWQRDLYNKLAARGIGWYWPYAVCQIFQESRWNQWSDNGVDKGITQQKGVYWANRAAHYGVAGADIWDVYAQFTVFAGMMADLLAANGSVEMALSVYFYGTGEYAPQYIADVMSHWAALEVVR